MRYGNRLLVSSLAVLVGNCGSEPQGPDKIDVDDARETRGTLIASGESVDEGLVWVPGTQLVAFTSPELANETCAIKTVDVASGSIAVVDDDCVSLTVLDGTHLRSLVAEPNGTVLLYTLGIGSPTDAEHVLRTSDPAGTERTELRGSISSALAVSPDGRRLAYRAVPESGSDAVSVIVRDLVTGNETHFADHAGDPIVFSPDATELLYEVRELPSLSRVLHRWSLDAGVDQVVSLPAGEARLFQWSADGIQVLAEVHDDFPAQYHVLDLFTGASVQVSLIQSGQDVPYEQLVWGHAAWSPDGTQVAYWTARCIEWAELFDCEIGRTSLYVADTRTGERARVVNTSDGSGPVAFSPDGTMLVYFSSPPAQVEGRFYLVELP